VDVERAAQLCAQGWTLSQIGAELGVRWNVVHDHLRRAGVSMRPVGAPIHPASTHEILDLRDQGLTWTEVAKRVDMTVSGAWSRYRNARPPKPGRLGRWRQVFAEALDHSFASTGRARMLYVSGADPDDASGDRSYLVLAKPNVIRNECAVKCTLIEWR
jgi:hypothetical protein